MTDNDKLPNFGDRPIKHVSLEQLQAAFSKALLEVIGKRYDVDIRKLDLEPRNEPSAWFYDTCDIDLRIKLVRDEKDL